MSAAARHLMVAKSCIRRLQLQERAGYEEAAEYLKYWELEALFTAAKLIGAGL